MPREELWPQTAPVQPEACLPGSPRIRPLRVPVRNGKAREAIVVVPPGYDADETRRYPVVYLLHGFGWNARGPLFWFGGGYANGVDLLAASAAAGCECIFVCPDGCNSLGGSMWEDSSWSGDVRTWLAAALPRAIDANFRTLPHARARGIAGHSMGAQAAVKIGILHPETFGSVYAMSGMMAFSEQELARYASRWAEMGGLSPDQLDSEHDEHSLAYAAMSCAFCSRHGPPDGFVHPRRPDGSLDPHLTATFLNEWPLPVARSRPRALAGLLGLGLEVGLHDEYRWGLAANREFVSFLQHEQIPFRYEEHGGSHSSALAERLGSRLIPFFSEIFSR